MIKIIDLEKESLTDFEKKYMFTEAPEEKERVNVKHIRLKAPDKRTYDFRKGASDEDDESSPEPEDIAVDDVDTEDPVDDTTAPVTSDDPVTADETDDDIVTDDESTTEVEGDNDNGDEETIDMNDDSTEDTGNDDIVTDDNSDTESDDDGDDSNEDDQTNIDMNDDSGDDIVTDDSGDISTDDGSSSDNSGDGDNSSDESSDNGGDEDSKNEGIHKQNLYRKFVSLKTSIDNYDHKLSSIIGIDPETHKMIHEITDKFKSLSDMMYDYMILKFKSNTYLESMLFYQRAMAATNLCLDALSKVSEASEDDNKKKSKKSNKK